MENNNSLRMRGKEGSAGRCFIATDEAAGARRVVVLKMYAGCGFWRRLFNGGNFAYVALIVPALQMLCAAGITTSARV